MDSFEYEPIDLDDCSIRLVRLSQGDDGPIRCELFHAWLHDTEDAIEYEALSYTWGGTDKPHQIEINGRKMSVTENLSLALQHLRYQHQDRILWIDAICIDQDNDKERGHQVRQMASIYKRAEQVIIWLGQATPETDLVFRYMHHLEKQTLAYACNNWRASDERWQFHWSNVRLLLSNVHEDIVLQGHKGLKILLGQSWFKRVWILQEVANARSATIKCGTQSVSARIFAIVPRLIGLFPDPHCQAVLDMMPGPSRKNSWWSQKRDLRTLLLKFRGSEATDSRDIIYALLNISSDAYNTETLVPNYEKSLKEVIHDTISFLLHFHDGKSSTYCLPEWTLSEFLQNLDSLGNAVFDWAMERKNHVMVKLLSASDDVDFNRRVGYYRSPLYADSMTLIGNDVPLTSDGRQAGIARRSRIKEILKYNRVGPVRALQASLNEFFNWSPDEVAALFHDFPPLSCRRLYPMGPESRYPPPGGRRMVELAGKLAVVGAVDALAVITSPLTFPRLSKEQRKKAISGLVEANKLAIGSSIFVSASLELMEEAGQRKQALCVNKWGQFKILGSGYAAISHVWSETLGLEFRDEKIDQDERGMLMTHFNKIMGKALMCGYDWIWFDLLAIPKKTTSGTGNPRFTQIKTLIINSLSSIYQNAATVIILDSFPLNLPSGDPLRVAALLVCGLWLTRIWTYQEIKLAHKALIVTATHVVDFQDMVTAVGSRAELDRQKWHELHKTVSRLQPIYGPGINLADVALSCTNRHTENHVDYARGFFALLGLQWQPGWTYEDGIHHIYRSRPQEVAMVASMHGPRGLPSPFSWAPKYLAQLEGHSQAPYYFRFTGNGLASSWYTATVLQLARVCSYGPPETNSDDKMAFQLLVDDVSGVPVMVTVVTWGAGWTHDLERWTNSIRNGNTRLLCSGEFKGKIPFHTVLLSIQMRDATPANNVDPVGSRNVAEVLASALLVNGTVTTPKVEWLLI